MMITLAGLCVVSMVGPLDQPSAVGTIRIHRPGGVEVVTSARGGDRVGDAIVVPSNAGGGGGTMTVVGGGEPVISTSVEWRDRPLGVTTEQLWRAFDTSRFGYTVIHGPGSYGHGHGHWRPRPPAPRPDPLLEQHLRNLAPIESRFPAAPGR